MDIIKIENLDFSYDNKVLFNNLNLKIKDKTWNTIIGSNGSGKSTLIRIILGFIKCDNVIVNGLKQCDDNKYEILKDIGCVFSNPNSNLICETVYDELSFALENLDVSEEIINERINNIIELFDFKKDLSCSINNLSLKEKQVVAIMSSLITNPKILILDEAFTYIDNKTKIKILNILKSIDFTIIYITHDMEDLLYTDNIIVLDDCKIVINEKKEEVFNKDLLKKYPFIVDLSIKLKYYDLIDDIAYSYRNLVDELWQ